MPPNADLKTKLLFWLFAATVRLLYSTYRVRVFDFHHREAAARLHPKGSFAFACWHGNSFVSTISHKDQKFCPLCSHSRDGAMVAYLCEKVNLRPVRGSSSRGGKDARTELIEQLAAGWSAAFTVDGPKGPPLKTKPGVVAVAQKSGAAILPMCSMPEKYWRLGSWDRLRIGKPFTRVAVLYRAPIVVDPQASGDDFDRYCARVDEELNAIDRDAPKLFDRWQEGEAWPARAFRPLPAAPKDQGAGLVASPP